MALEQIEELDPMKESLAAVHAEKTKHYYEKRMDEFLAFVGAEGETTSERAKDFIKRAREEPTYANSKVNLFLNHHIARVKNGEIQASTLSIYYKPVRNFCVMNDIVLNWEKISKKMPHGKKYADDRAPTREEILTLMKYPDRRIKPVVLTMVSSGIRIGAWDTLNWGHVEPVREDGAAVAAKLRVYAGDREEYTTFVSGEAYRSLEEYVKFRQSSGERVERDSPLMRDLFTPDRGARGEPHRPKRLTANGVKRLLEDALKGTGLRGDLPKGKRRHEFQGAHGMRKAFKTICENSGMNRLRIEMLMGHDTGINMSYDRPTDAQLFEDYKRALPTLTVLEPIGPQPSDVLLRAQGEEIKTMKRLFELFYRREKAQKTWYDAENAMNREALEFMRSVPETDPDKRVRIQHEFALKTESCKTATKASEAWSRLGDEIETALAESGYNV